MSEMNRLLRPKSIAVIGGTQAERVAEQCQKMGFQGHIWPVNPRRETMSGIKTYADLSSLPGIPDAAYVAVNREQTIEIVKSLAELGAGGAVCYASGFGELGRVGERLQGELIEASGTMPVIGPNCYGFINYVDGALLWPDQHGGIRLKTGSKGVAIIAQSSNIAINFSMEQRGLPLAYLVTVGNQAKIGLSHMAMALLDDPNVTALGLHIEGFDSIGTMEAVAKKARMLNKPIVALKIGVSEFARWATLSHTASVAGKYASSRAFLTRNGFGQARTISEFLESLKLLHSVGTLTGHRLSSMSCSGGEASIIADASVGKKVVFPDLSDEQKKPLESALGPMVPVSNPLDYHTYCWGKPDEMKGVYSAMLGLGFDLNLLIMDFPHHSRCDDSEWVEATSVFMESVKETGGKGALVVSMPENISESYAKWYMERGLPVLLGIEEALRACEIAGDIQQAWNAPPPLPILQLDAIRGRGTVIDEARAKATLAEFGLSVPGGVVVDSAEMAVEKAESIGFPLVLKALGIAHKTEVNGVRIGLMTKQEVREAAQSLLSLTPNLYLERMVQSNVAELIIGVTRDAQMGLRLMIGSGGVLVELLHDTATLLIPASREDVATALNTLQMAPLLDGYRGRPKADVKAVLDSIMAVQYFAMDQSASLIELDINPLIVGAEGWGAFAADILLTVEETENDRCDSDLEEGRDFGSNAGSPQSECYRFADKPTNGGGVSGVS